jgi:lipopolysaccharide biosynthesis regulator YciM
MRMFSSRAAVVALVLAAAVMASGCGQIGKIKAKMAVKKGNPAYTAQDYKVAAAHYEDALTNDPSMTDLYFFLGNSYDNLYRPAKKGDATNDAYLTKAIENYKKGAESAQTPSIKQLSLQYLVNAYNSPDKMNDPAQAEPLLLSMIQLDPKDTRNYVVLSRIYEDAGDYERAEQQLVKAREANAKDTSVYMMMAGFYQRQGDFDKMIEAVQERTRQEPNNPEAFYTLATFYWEKASRDVKLSDAQKATYANAGLEAVNKALDLKDDYFEALTYKNLLLRTKANISKDPKEQQQFLKEADELRKKAEELRNKQRAAADSAKK